MCGIIGILAEKHIDPLSAIKGGIGEIIKRGPDEIGYFASDKVNLALGHTRLSILDLTPTGAQPMESSSNLSVISYNGEIYNVSEIKNILIQNNIRLRGTSDTELILELIELRGFKEALKLIKGMFALAYFDKKKLELNLARDRFGEKPLYYGFLQSGFAFCSELIPLLKMNKDNNFICKKALGSYLNYNYVPAPLSIIKGIYKLLPGEFISLKLNGEIKSQNLNKEFFWTLSSANSDTVIDKFNNLDQAKNTFSSLFRDVIKDFMNADVKVGSLLSGGIDSSIIALLGSKDFKLSTYTLGFEDEAFDETAYARSIVNLIGSDHTEIMATNDEIVNAIPHMPNVYGEPFADVSQLPSFVISKHIATDVKVCLAGDGGDELFLGYPRYNLLKNITRIPNRNGLSKILKLLPFDALVFIIRKLGKKISPDNLMALQMALKSNQVEEIYEILFSYWKDLEKIMTDKNIPHVMLKNNIDLNVDPVEIGGLIDLQNYLPDNLLVKMDRASMAHSLEIRLPFLDMRVLNFSSRLTTEMKWSKNLGSKTLLKSVLLDYLPEEFVRRKKQGFSVPLGKWINGILSDFVDEMLSEAQLSKHGLFEQGEINRILNSHRENKYDFSKYLWSIVMFQLWYIEFSHLLAND